MASVIEANASLAPLGEFAGSAKRLAKPGTHAPDAAEFDLPPPGALHPRHRVRSDAGGRDTADLGPLLFPDHRSVLIRRKVGDGPGPILSDADGNSPVEPWTAARVLLGQLPSIATAVRGRYTGGGHYCVVDIAVDAVPGSLLESVADQRPPRFELSN